MPEQMPERETVTVPPAVKMAMEAMENEVRFCLRVGESENDRFERIGEWFQSETGYLRPGKSYPMTGPPPEDREQVWDAWLARKRSVTRAALAALKAEYEDGGLG